MFFVDAKGLTCPKPVIMAKKALLEHDDILVEVDNPMSAQNLEKMAQVMGLSFEVSQKGDVYELHMLKEGQGSEEQNSDDYVVVCRSPFMGGGNDELGAALMKSFIYTLTEAECLPSAMIFYNGGVKLTTEGSAVLEDLKKLENAGVEILSCGTCLNYYGLSEQLKVGNITNMYVIFEKQQKAKKVIQP